ncbi:ArsR/SmtB family transcription factor [Anaerovorax odorimutans]|uniref:ArsR/SmtB family transcription factor n=1 Tax=Anaerovorax odorimutans TaxID=109327 RepID=UPI000424A9BA|nr:metalloregulator ArsR/SmtB family transcription factor [Anaerovorax odorimutans]
MTDKLKDAPLCDCTIIHDDVVEKVKNKMPEQEDMYLLSELYKSFADQTRLKILYALSEEDMCVCDIAALLNLSQSAISHQLRVLRNIRLVKYIKKGKVVYYSLDDDHVRGIFNLGLEHISHTK